MPPMMLMINTTGSGRSRAPSTRSSSRPLVVPVANQPRATAAAARSRASANRARSRGRRSRLGMTPSSMTMVPDSVTPSDPGT